MRPHADSKAIPERESEAQWPSRKMRISSAAA